jgi:hypothetical protein
VDVGKLPNHLKLCGLYLLALDQFLLYFIIQTVSNGLKFMMLQSFICGSIIVTFYVPPLTIKKLKDNDLKAQTLSND